MQYLWERKKPVATEDEANATVQSGGEVNGAVPSGVEVKDTVPSEDLGQNSASGGTVGAVDGVPNIPVGGGLLRGKTPLPHRKTRKTTKTGQLKTKVMKKNPTLCITVQTTSCMRDLKAN